MTINKPLNRNRGKSALFILLYTFVKYPIKKNITDIRPTRRINWKKTPKLSAISLVNTPNNENKNVAINNSMYAIFSFFIIFSDYCFML